MIEKKKQGAKQAARDLYRAGRITLETAIWALQNAGYSQEERAEWVKSNENLKRRGNSIALENEL
jgi:hypothetical protein